MKTNTYILGNINQCAFLLSNEGIELLEVQEDKFHHFSFILSNPDKCEELRRQYLNGASAPAMELFSKREMLLGEIKSKSQSNRGGKNHE